MSKKCHILSLVDEEFDSSSSLVEGLENKDMESLNIDDFMDTMGKNSTLVIDESLLFLPTDKAEPKTRKFSSVTGRSSRCRNNQRRPYYTLPKEKSPEKKVNQISLKLESLPDSPRTTRRSYEENKRDDYSISRVKGSSNKLGNYNSTLNKDFSSSPQQSSGRLSMTSIDTAWIEWKGRQCILDALDQDEKEKYAILQKAVDKEGWSYQPIDLAQFLIVSHCNVSECLSRMLKWRKVMKECKDDKVLVRDGLAWLDASNDYWEPGGCDPDGRRVLIFHFGNVSVNHVLNEFSRFCMSANLFWDALTINVSEVRAGMACIADLRGFGYSNWSLKLFVQVLQMIWERYPIRMRRIYCVDAPAYFWVIFKVATMVMPKKMKDRIQFITSEDLVKIIPRASIPPSFGGAFKEAPRVAPWVVKRLKQRYGDSWASNYRK